jgi:tRNA(Arg) A34 adenosine deaminase TadA
MTSWKGFEMIQEDLNLSMDSIRLAKALYTPTILCIEGVASRTRRAEQQEDDSNYKEGADDDESADLPDDKYLCCGLDLYAIAEPDVMSAMALVHSRINRVFILNIDEENGGCGSVYHIHSLRSLNHHYRVFRIIY